ncbi:hypothetical protein COO60DRAFT_1479360 [Scenedesmus sp. NREL 46B-D3]|nr:hypothetical protein COO60DRAFT_1479360 [Scenedesmus sp. NREL 46B-D3]
MINAVWAAQVCVYLWFKGPAHICTCAFVLCALHGRLARRRLCVLRCSYVRITMSHRVMFVCCVFVRVDGFSACCSPICLSIVCLCVQYTTCALRSVQPMVAASLHWRNLACACAVQFAPLAIQQANVGAGRVA